MRHFDFDDALAAGWFALIISIVLAVVAAAIYLIWIMMPAGGHWIVGGFAAIFVGFFLWGGFRR